MRQGERRPSEGDTQALASFITAKYADRAYSLRGYEAPPTIENYTSHPFMRQLLASEAGEAAQQQAVQVRTTPRPTPPEAGKPTVLSLNEYDSLFVLLSLAPLLLPYF